MAKPKPHYIDVDLKKKMQLHKILVTQHDSNVVFVARVTDDGRVDPDILDSFPNITLTSKRPDRKAFYTLGKRIPDTNEVEFNLGTMELEMTGEVTASLQLYGFNEEGIAQRLSSAPFDFTVTSDISALRQETERELSLMEIVLTEGLERIKEATAVTEASIAAREKLTKDVGTALTNLETEKGEFLEGVTRSVDVSLIQLEQDRQATITATGNANNSASNANVKAGLAGDAAALANQSAADADRARKESALETQKAKDQTALQLEQINEVASTLNYVNNEFIPEIDQKYEQVEADVRNMATKGKIYGVYWPKTAESALTRTKDAIGMVANVGVGGEFVRNDFDVAEIYREIGERTDKLGNVYIWIPKFYIKKTDGAGFKTIEISKQQYAGFYLPKCFWDFESGTELPGVYVGKYRASKSAAGRLESLVNVYPMRNHNIVQTRDAARLNNDATTKGYQQYDIHIHDVISTLFYVEFATLNSQAVMSGFSSGQYSASHVAALAETQTNRFVLVNAFADNYRLNQSIGIGTSLGGNNITDYRTITAIEVVDAANKAIVFDGPPLDVAIGNIIYNTGYKTGFSKNIAASSGSLVSNTDGKHACMYRGIESPWGDMWCFVDGVNINDRQAWAAEDADGYMSNLFAAPYEQIGYINSAVDGYLKYTGWDAKRPYIELPVEVGGNTVTYYADYYYQTTGQRVLLVGGSWTYGAYAGLSYWYAAYTSSSSNLSFGGRLCLKSPLAL